MAVSYTHLDVYKRQQQGTDEFYQLGTSVGKLKSLYIRNQFTRCTENFISVAEAGNE